MLDAIGAVVLPAERFQHEETTAYLGPKAWNQLPMHIRARESVGPFKTALKSHFQFVD